MGKILFMLVTASLPLIVSGCTYLCFTVHLISNDGSDYSGGSGSLITPTWVLTAAHCVEDPLITHVEYRERGSVTTTEINNRVKHPGYRKGKFLSNDIGLLRVTKVNPDSLGQLSSVEYTSLIGITVKYIGFGGFKAEEDNQWTGNRTLLPGQGMLTSCQDNPSTGPVLCGALACSYPKHGYNFKGSNGGPVVSDAKIVAIISQTEEKAPLGRFTPVSPFLSWINYEISKINKTRVVHL